MSRFPASGPSIVVVVTTVAIGSLKIYDVVAVMTGGRSNSTVLAFEMVNQQQRFQSYGHSAALAVVLFLFVVPLIVFNVDSDQEAEGDPMTIEVIEPVADPRTRSPARPRHPQAREVGAEAAHLQGCDDRGDRHRLLLDDPDVRASRHFVPTARRHPDLGVVDRLHGSGLLARELRRCADVRRQRR